MLPLVLLMRATVIALTPPSTSTPTVASTNAGTCPATTPGTAAAIRVSWTVGQADTTLYTAKLYENGILQSTQDTTASMSWDKRIVGTVENGTESPWTSDWTYRVDIVRKADGQVMDSKTSATWAQQYGGCP